MRSPQNQIKIALIQSSCSEDISSNQQQIDENIKSLASQGVQLVLLQELHNSLYFCQTEDPSLFDLAETIPGPSTERLGQLAKSQQVVIVASLFEKRAAGLYHNTAVVLDTDGSIAGIYRKMHIPDDPGFYEKFYFTPGDLGFTPIQTSLGKLGVLVCWDQWFPEAARLMCLAGAELLLYPTAIGWDPADDKDEQARQLDAWMTIQRGHAIANGIPVVVCNRTGFEASPEKADNGIQFWGNSFIAGPQGEILAQASQDKPEIITHELDMNRSESVRRIWPYLRDRRIDAYEDLSLRYRDKTE
ncbi:MAG: carbon-nitrogen hydrolase [Gammaproteobacteria bacterium]|nr:carbon-nitrogen hydrolase [Gammaproteobacteria bacterium]